MSEQPNIVEDLEDGEIESDEEEVKEAAIPEKTEEPANDVGKNDERFARSGKKKKSKNNKADKKKDKKKNNKYTEEKLEDIASNIENALRNEINMEGQESLERNDNGEERKKRKKRKKNDGRDGSSKKRKKQDYSDDVDESEMMFVRGASPVRKTAISDDDNSDSYETDSSHGSRGFQPQSRPQRRRNQRDRKNNKNNNDRERRRGAHPNQDPDGICLYFMQGKCHKGDDCMFSHDALPPRKMELCKFYLMECCAKRDKCLYMHADFPCKYYHTGLPCIYKDECKFAHGQPLTENLKNILLKHIESAPKEILGDFPRLNRDGALKMINTTQLKLMQQFPNADFNDTNDRNIPSLFDFNLGNPQNNYDISQNNQMNNDKHSIKQKMRQSRWQNEESPIYNHNINQSALNNFDTANVLNIKNLTGVLTPRQISDLTKMGIENLDQLGQLTVLQLNSIGISLKQITEIQLNTMSIQKLGLINSNEQPPLSQTSVIHAPLTSCSMDLDLRVHPIVAVSKNSVTTTILPGQDIDMRFHNSKAEDYGIKNENKAPKDTIDIDQYTKDALKFATKEKDNIEIDQKIETEKSVDDNVITESKDVDHRVLPFTKNTPSIVSSDTSVNNDTDIRFLQPEPVFRPCPAKRNRRSTTDDDEESNLLIDEKWYSSDDEKNGKRKSPAKSPGKSPQLMSPPYTPAPHVIEPSSVLSRLGDLSKIDISEEVTKLLNTMKNNMQDTSKPEEEKPAKSRDPRSRRSPPQPSSSPNQDSNLSKLNPKKPKVSIYECVDGEPTDGRRRSDIDLRETSAIGDTDLRHSSCGDIDLRLGLPFKPLPNYTPASEIDGSISSHPPITYKLVRIDIPRPDYTDIRNSTAKSQALVDPRLRKVFRLSLDESNSDNEKSVKSPATVSVTAAAPRLDPRRKQKDAENSTPEQRTSLDLQIVIQNSEWYKDLSSTQKIFVNQQIAIVTSMIKQFHSDKTPGKKFDLSAIQNNSVFNSIFTNLSITLGENGEFSYLPKPKEALLKTPPFNPSSSPYNNMPGHGAMDNPMINMPPMGMGGVGPMGMGNMGGYNAPFPDPRNAAAPGLLGMAPNMPPNFNYGNMPYNGPGPDFGNMDMENYQRFSHNRGGHRGRGNERWNRGGPRAGPRDRNRGNWKGHQ